MMIFLKKAVIFDIESANRCNATSRESMRIAIKEETNYDIDKKIIYLLEGMPGAKLVKEIFKRENIDKCIDDNLVEEISKRKKAVFKEIQKKSIEGARELVNDLKSCRCLKAVASGSAKQEIETTLEENIGLKNFDIIVTGDEVG